MQDSRRAYNYEATKIELLGGLSEKAEASSRNPSSSISTTNLLKGVEKSYKKGEYLTDFSKVLDENGEPMVVYHGTNTNIDAFDAEKIGSNSGDYGTAGKGFYFTADRENAENIARVAAKENGGEPTVIPVYLNIRNPKTGVDIMETDGSNSKAEKLTQKAKEQGYDGIEATRGYGRNAFHWYVAFDPKQIKSAEANSGEFGDTPDIRFSIRKPKAGEEDKSLVGVHNISEDKLVKALNLGGLANPSAAVIDLNVGGHDNYGDISLVMPSALVDKNSGRNAGTWMADAYTPRFPRTYKTWDDKAWTQMSKDLKVKNNESSATNDRASGLGQPTENDAPMSNFDAKIRVNDGFEKNVDNLITKINETGQLGAHEMLFELAKSFGFKGEKLDKSKYFNLDNGVQLRIADHF